MENIASRKQSDLGADESDAAPGSGVLGVLLQILQKQRAPLTPISAFSASATVRGHPFCCVKPRSSSALPPAAPGKEWGIRDTPLRAALSSPSGAPHRASQSPGILSEKERLWDS